VAIDGATVWVSDPSRGAVVGLNGAGQPTVDVPLGGDFRATGLAATAGRVWVADLGGSVATFEVDAPAVITRVAVGPGEPAAIAVVDGSAWIAAHGPSGAVAKVQANSIELLDRVKLSESPFAIDGRGDVGEVWIAGLDSQVFALDAATGAVTGTVALEGSPRGIAVSKDGVWITLRDSREVVRLDRITRRILARIPTDGHPWPIAIDGDLVWVAELEGRLLQIDARTNRVVTRTPTGISPRGIAVGLGAVWVASSDGTVTRVARPARSRVSMRS